MYDDLNYVSQIMQEQCIHLSSCLTTQLYRTPKGTKRRNYEAPNFSYGAT